MRLLAVLFFFSLSSSLWAQINPEAPLSPDTTLPEPATELPQIPPVDSAQNPLDATTLAPEKSSNETSDFYSYTQTLEDFRGLQVTAIAGYRVPKSSPLEAGFELILTFRNPNPETNTELQTLGNQAILQIYAPRSGLLRYRVNFVRAQESPENEIIYRATEQQDPFFLRFLNELEGGRTAQLFLTQNNSRERIRVNFNLNLSPLQDLWKFSQNLSTKEASPALPISSQITSPPASPLP